MYSNRIYLKYSNNGVSYDSDTAYNEAYNGTEWTANKPGNQYVLANYGEAADVTNVYIVKSEDILMDGGKVLPRLAQAMYGRITDMDNLNKRLGEARFIDQEDGLWVRLRYDRMGKDDQFRLRGKTAELDSVNSLISRLGIRVGREFGGNDRHQMYGYVNVLHEFMGETGVFAYDNSGAFRSEKTNKGTWMTVGLGGSTQLNDQTSIFFVV